MSTRVTANSDVLEHGPDVVQELAGRVDSEEDEYWEEDGEGEDDDEDSQVEDDDTSNKPNGLTHLLLAQDGQAEEEYDEEGENEDDEYAEDDLSENDDVAFDPPSSPPKKRNIDDVEDPTTVATVGASPIKKVKA